MATNRDEMERRREEEEDPRREEEEESREGKVMDFDEDPSDSDVQEAGDGYVVQVEEGDDVEETKSFYDNLASQISKEKLESLSTELDKAVEQDKKVREKRSKQYAEAIKRTGLGEDAPGGANFEGASKAVHPVLTEAAVDYAARAVRELLPPGGPVKTWIPGESNAEPKRYEKADRKKAYMNWQFLQQMGDFRTELEQLLTQNALSGSQYMRVIPDHSKKDKRPSPTYVPSDLCFMPHAASSWKNAERQTYAEPVTKMEFLARVRNGMYEDIGEIGSTQQPEETDPEKATKKVQGISDDSWFDEDGERTVYEISTWLELDDDEHTQGESAPYLVSLDEPTKKITRVVRNWEEDDEDQERMDWIVEFPFIPWRGSGSVGLGQMIGSLAGAATGALRALLDSAHVNNMPTAVRLKGANFTGQNVQIQATEIAEIDGGVAGDDIRKLLMQLPFNPPSEVLLSLLGTCVKTARGVVRTSFEELSENNKNLPVGSTLAMIEEGMKTLSAIHLRAFHAMTQVIEIVHRIDKMYVTEEEIKNDTGDVLAYREDFEGALDVVPTADPEIFSDVQRIAQLQIVADRAVQMPQLYNAREVEKRLLERTRIPNPESLLVPAPEPKWMNAVNENASMSLGKPVSAFPEQDHLAHIQVHLDYLLNPNLGMLPIIAPTFIAALLDHLKEHVTLWYVDQYYEALKMSTQTDDDGVTEIVGEKDPETRAELDRTLAAASPIIDERSKKVLAGVSKVVQQAMQIMEQYKNKPEEPIDPNKMADIQQKREQAQMRHQEEVQKLQADLRKHGESLQLDISKLSAEQRKNALDRAREEEEKIQERIARLKELGTQERAEDERKSAELASLERRNTQDNMTALRITAAEIESEEDSDLSTGTGINPGGSGS